MRLRDAFELVVFFLSSADAGTSECHYHTLRGSLKMLKTMVPRGRWTVERSVLKVGRYYLQDDRKFKAWSQVTKSVGIVGNVLK